MRIGVLTGGGDCPGLNAVIRAIVRKAERHHGDVVLGFRDGWRGMLDQEFEVLDVERMRGTLPRGGTVLGTSRDTPYRHPDGIEKLRACMADHQIDALIVIGGEGTLSVARKIQDEGAAPVIGIPKTIDNDIDGTEVTFGFDTAVAIATEAIDRLHTTAESHDRVMVVEVMGRHVGHIAVTAGLAGGATMTLIPEQPFDIEAVAESIRRRHQRGRFASIVVVAEGALPQEGTMPAPDYEIDQFGHQRLGGIADRVASEIEQRTGYETRVTVLGHVQRGGSPTAYDRVLCSRYGVAAVEAVHDGAFGQMVALRGGSIVTVPLAEATGRIKTVSPEFYETARVFFA